jgi:GT2 family glycosyltransferase
VNVPRVAVIIPAYNSHDTLSECLAALGRQTLADFEVILIDSSPEDRISPLLSALFPTVRYIHSPTRLLPHTARNRGVKLARGELLVFTDPDIYPSASWLAQLVEQYEKTGNVITGPISCYGRRWFDVGVHLSKFSKCLPGGKPRPTNLAPTGNMLCPRAVFESLGGLREDVWASDSIFSIRLQQHGYGIWYVPDAVVLHDHRTTWRSFLRERYTRGLDAGRLRAAGQLGGASWGRGRLLVRILTSFVPLRLLTGCTRIALAAIRARMLGDFLWTLPIILAGHTSLLWGEGKAYLERLASPPEKPQPTIVCKP